MYEVQFRNSNSGIEIHEFGFMNWRSRIGIPELECPNSNSRIILLLCQPRMWLARPAFQFRYPATLVLTGEFR